MARLVAISQDIAADAASDLASDKASARAQPADVDDALDGPTPQNRRIKSIEVAFRVIRVLEEAGGFLPLVRVAALVGMPSSKVHIYLASLVREGLVVQDAATRHYGLGQFSVQLGLTAIRGLDVVTAGRDVVDRLRDATGCSISLSIWGNRGPTIVVKADGGGQGSLGIRLGHVFRLTTSASGRLFLAYRPVQELQEVLEIERRIYPDSPPVDLKSIRQEILDRGYATSVRPTASGRHAVAVPVLDFSNGLVATIAALAAPGYTADGSLAAIVASGKELSRRLGAHGDGTIAATMSTSSELRLLDKPRKRKPLKIALNPADR